MNLRTLAATLMAATAGLLLASCKTSGQAYNQSTTTTSYDDADEEQQPELAFIAGTVAYDSIQDVYSMTLRSIKRVEGQAHISNGEIDADGHYLHCTQKDGGGTTLTTNNFTNPLNEIVEYPDDNGGFGHQIVRRDSADFFFRIQLHPSASSVAFSIGDRAIAEFSLSDY